MAMTHPVSDGLEYHERVDEDLVAIAKSGDNLAMEYLLNKYKNFVRIKAKSYFLIGADREDIIQEGMIGLYKAVRDFKADKLSSFRAFAELCITRQIITAIKTATRQKHIPLNQYISLNKPIYDEDSERTLLDVMASQKKGMKRYSSPRGADSPSPQGGEGRRPQGGGVRGKGPVDPTSRPHKPHLDEMGIATWHEFKPARPGKDAPRKPTLDEMGPGVESVPAKRGAALEAGRSTMGRAGQHGGFKANKKRR